MHFNIEGPNCITLIMVKIHHLLPNIEFIYCFDISVLNKTGFETNETESKSQLYYNIVQSNKSV